MDALILAAGQGTRLKPITDHITKPMIPFWGQPFLEYLINNLSQLKEIDRILIVVNYLQNQIRGHFGNRWQGKEIVYLEQANPKGGTADAVSSAKDIIKDDFITILGDVYLSQPELKRLIASSGTKLAVTKIDDPENHKVVNFAKDNLVTGFGDDSQWADLGFWRFTPEIFSLIEKARLVFKNEEELKVLPVLDFNLDRVEPQVILSRQPWIQIGDHEEARGILLAKDYLYQGKKKAVPSSIECRVKNCQINNSVIFGPGRLIDSEIKKSLVYISDQARGQNIINKISVL